MDAFVMLSRDAILGFKDTRIGRIDVPELGGEVCIASLTAQEADQIRKLGEDGTPASVGVVILGACDETGARLFTDKDKPALAKLPASVMGRIGNAILKHNGLTGEAQDEVKNA
jgi:hypothetical protein